MVKPAEATRDNLAALHQHEETIRAESLALQLLFLKASESMGNHDSEVVGACSVD
jgi:hypothetical protein